MLLLKLLVLNLSQCFRRAWLRTNLHTMRFWCRLWLWLFVHGPGELISEVLLIWLILRGIQVELVVIFIVIH